MKQLTDIIDILACPICKQSLAFSDDRRCRCQNSACAREFPVVSEVPVLINEGNSVYNIQDFVASEGNATATTRTPLFNVIWKLVPSVTRNWRAEANYAKLSSLVQSNQEEPIILIVGCGEGGEGVDRLLNNQKLRCVETDVSFTSRAQVVADGHDLPFKDSSFDAVICQAVLEHVLDPYRCVEEMHRVLKTDGLIYAETPFLYPVHMKAHDFTRFTLGGHRRLFRYFDEISAGAVLGPATTLALAIVAFFRAFSGSVVYRGICSAVIPFFVFWLKYVDYFLVDRPAASDSAAGFFFLGRRRANAVPDREIIKWHWTSTLLEASTQPCVDQSRLTADIPGRRYCVWHPRFDRSGRCLPATKVERA